MSDYEVELHIGTNNRAYRVAAAVLTVACIGCVVASHFTRQDLFDGLAWVTGTFAVVWGLRVDFTVNSPARSREDAR